MSIFLAFLEVDPSMAKAWPCKHSAGVFGQVRPRSHETNQPFSSLKDDAANRYLKRIQP